MKKITYYTPPSDEAFEEVKRESISIWSKYDDSYGYAEKIERIKDLPNVSDNFMYMIAMFDLPNQLILSYRLTKKTRAEVKKRLLAGGMEERYIYF